MKNKIKGNQKKGNQKNGKELVKKINSEDFYDDCPICQAMKAAENKRKELNVNELKGAFVKAKERGGIIGGEWFKKSK